MRTGQRIAHLAGVALLLATTVAISAPAATAEGVAPAAGEDATVALRGRIARVADVDDGTGALALRLPDGRHVPLDTQGLPEIGPRADVTVEVEVPERVVAAARADGTAPGADGEIVVGHDRRGAPDPGAARGRLGPGRRGELAFRRTGRRRPRRRRRRHGAPRGLRRAGHGRTGPCAGRGRVRLLA